MRRARKSMSQINVVPYIDVMLVLLVIFMVTAPLVSPGEIALPSVGSRLTVLVARIVAKQQRSPDQGVVIAADKSSRYEDVLGVLDLLQRNGVRKVGLLAR